MDCEECDYLPKKICRECRFKLETLYLFKTKSLESDAALRKLILTQTASKGLDRRFDDSTVFVSSYQPAPPPPPPAVSQSPVAAGGRRVHTPKTEIEVEEFQEDDVIEQEEEEHVDDFDEYDLTQQGGSSTIDEDQFEIHQEFTYADVNCPKRPRYKEPQAPVKLVSRPDIPTFEAQNLRLLEPPFQFPLRTPEEVMATEAWINENPLHFEKVVFIVQRKIAHSSIDTAVKKCFEYEIVTHFWHSKGQKRPGGTSINTLRLFTEVFEEAIKDFEEVDLDAMFKLFFKNARNCLRARKSREKHRKTFPSGAITQKFQ